MFPPNYIFLPSNVTLLLSVGYSIYKIIYTLKINKNNSYAEEYNADSRYVLKSTS